jgi:hypothetical protein
MTNGEFISFFYSQFGYDYGSPINIIDGLSTNFSYLGRGIHAAITENNYTILNDTTCKHENKYVNKLTKNLEFMVCPDCKEEIK